MASHQLTTIRAIHDAYDRRDIATVRELLDEHVDFEVPSGVPYGGRFEGRAEVGRFFPLIAEYIEDLRVELHELIDAGDIVVSLCTLSGTGRGGGTHFDADGAFVWRFAEGRVVAFKEYSDTARIREGLPAGFAATG